MGTLRENLCKFMSLNSSPNEKYFRQKWYRKSKHTFYIQKIVPEIHALHEIMCKNVAQLDRPEKTV